MIHQVSGALDAGVGQLADFLAVEAVPPSTIELLIKLQDEFRMDEVDKGVAHITGIIMVDGQVQEVDVQPMVLVDFLEQHFLGVLVWDVSDHEGGPAICLNLTYAFFTLLGIIRN